MRGQGPTGVHALFRVFRMQLPSLSFVNEATDCSFWGSFPKVCHVRKRQDVNVLSRKKQFHSQMSWDMRVKEKQTGLFLQEIESIFFLLRSSMHLNQGTEACCISAYGPRGEHLQKAASIIHFGKCSCRIFTRIPAENRYTRFSQVFPAKKKPFFLPSFPCLGNRGIGGKLDVRPKTPI